MVGMEPKLLTWRSQLDKIDEQVIALLAKRFEITHQVGVYKAKHGLSARDIARENAMVQRIHNIAQQAGLDVSVAENYLKTIWTHSLAKHQQISAQQEEQS